MDVLLSGTPTTHKFWILWSAWALVRNETSQCDSKKVLWAYQSDPVNEHAGTRDYKNVLITQASDFCGLNAYHSEGKHISWFHWLWQNGWILVKWEGLYSKAERRSLSRPVVTSTLLWPLRNGNSILLKPWSSKIICILYDCMQLCNFDLLVPNWLKGRFSLYCFEKPRSFKAFNVLHFSFLKC